MPVLPAASLHLQPLAGPSLIGLRLLFFLKHVVFAEGTRVFCSLPGKFYFPIAVRSFSPARSQPKYWESTTDHLSEPGAANPLLSPRTPLVSHHTQFIIWNFIPGVFMRYSLFSSGSLSSYSRQLLWCGCPTTQTQYTSTFGASHHPQGYLCTPDQANLPEKRDNGPPSAALDQ